MIVKLTKFKKFAPPIFKEAKTPSEVEEWLNELKIILEVLKTEEEDKIPFTNFCCEVTLVNDGRQKNQAERVKFSLGGISKRYF